MLARVAGAVAVAVLVMVAGPGAFAAERADTLRLVATLSSRQSVDVGGAGRSPGDLVVELSGLRRAADQTDVAVGGPVGANTVATTRLAGNVGNVVSTAVVPGGTITAGGVSTGRQLAVLGGTGDYANARGSLVVKRLDARRSLLVFTLFLVSQGEQGPAGSQG